MKPLIWIATIAITVYACNAPTEKKPIIPDSAGNRTPEQELAGFKVPNDFIVELVASEKDGVIKPIDITFDDAGRLWTQTATMYPLDPIADIKWNDLLQLMNNPEKQKEHPNFKRVSDLYKGYTKGTDKIIVLSNFYDYKNHFVKSQVWADGLTIPMSILPYKNGALVAQGSEMFFLDDSDKDGKADKRDSLFTGFGFTDTHTMAHSLVRGPGGWVYFSHGALNKGQVTSYVSDAKVAMDYSKIARFTNDGKKIELVAAGLNNIWGFQLRDNGQWYMTEANDLGFSVVPMEPGMALRGIGNERFRPYQPWLPELHTFRVGGTGISGMAFDDDLEGSYPAEWKNVAFLANPITSTINAVRIKRNADGTVTAAHLEDFLVSEDKRFRPVNIEFGPDGSLYIADWYNKIISHNEIPTTHPDRDKSLGRIWRIRHKSQKPKNIVNYYEVATDALPAHLKSPSFWARRAALNQILERPATETKNLVPAVTDIVKDASQPETVRIHALWALEGLQHYDAELVKSLLASDKTDDLRREAVRALVNFSLPAADLANMVEPLVDDANVMVRSQVLRTLTEAGTADANTIRVLLKACKPELAGNHMGGSYERKFERYLALVALEQYNRELQAYLQGNPNANPSQLLWASMALPSPQKEQWFLKAWQGAQVTDLKETEFVLVANMLGNTKVLEVVKPVIQNPAYSKNYIRTALNNEDALKAPHLATLLQPTVVELLKSSDVEDNELALNAVTRLKTKVPSHLIAGLIKVDADERIFGPALRALEPEATQYKSLFVQTAQNEKLGFSPRIIALQNLVKADATTALPVTRTVFNAANAEQKKQLVSSLSGNNQGASILKTLYTEKLIGLEAIDLSAAERIRNADPKDARGSEILSAIHAKIEEEKKAFEDKLQRYLAIANKNEGSADKGKTIFQSTCLACHKVGDKGQDIAPALDGSANRDNEALVTALLDPDAAVEGGYEVYRVIKKDKSVLEGYLYKRAENGLTIAVMGGNKIFIPHADIQNSYTLGGRSFMPKGLLDQYSDEEVANLFAYIKTLK